ncbi:MAG TPA: YihY/virulence factor BrkB family protein [Acidimicrobiia bacterium]|nr:YihY/virulence factor BrkB family protein [Acidimicrobiia bacterium]
MAAAGKGKGVLEKALVGAVAVAVVKKLKDTPRHAGGAVPRPESDDGPRRAVSADGNRHHDGAGSPETRGIKGLAAKFDRYQRSHSWLGFPVAAGKKFGEDQAGNLAALISYYTFFSIFPLLLVLVTILGLVLEGNVELQRQVVDSALAQFPVIGNQIRDNIGSLGGNWLALAVGLGGALWAGLGAVDAAQNAMNSVWDVPIRDKPKFVTRRLRSLLMLVVIGGGLFLTAAASTVASSADSIGPLGRFLAPLLSAGVNILVFMVAFRVLTERDIRWSDVVPGAVVAGIAAAVLQLAGGFIMDQKLQGASQTYGTFGVVIGLLSWIYLQAQITLLAAELNVVRTERLWPRSLITDPDDLTEADRRALAKHAETEERVPEQDVRTAVPGEQHERGVDRPVPRDRDDSLVGAR